MHPSSVLWPLLAAQASVTSAALYDAPVMTNYGAIQGYPAFDSEPAGNISNWASITTWKNVPYAADTSGSNRWRPPQKPSAWNGSRDGEDYGPMCPGVRTDTGDFAVSEDCLNLNIWSPANSTAAKLPVMLWSTPAYATARDALFDGGGMAGQGIVFVNYNRRDGIFGYLAHPELGEEMLADVGVNASGTWGVLDQFAALQWVHDNIEAFGGDPTQITVAGQSAGSAATYHMVNGPLVKGLIKHAIIESGLRYPYDPLCSTLAENYITLEAAEATGEAALTSYNVSTIEELRSVDMDTLAANTASWHVVLDGYALPNSYIESLIDGPANDVPIITGNTKDESGASTDTNLTVAEYKAALVTQYGEDYADKFFELYPANDSATASAAYNAHYTDTSRVSSWLFANTWQQYEQSPFWTYYWDHAPPGQSEGAYHESEINYVLNNLYLTDSPWEEEDYAIAAKMNAYWANFVKTGNPNDGGSYLGSDTLVNWPESTAERNVTHHVGDGWGEVLVASTSEQVELFEEFFATQTPF
ncbi:carboxylesterase [Phytophthora cinnamomi]|uniref:carboxylesterase n=1 Tax=Phytophthora cinnamomi TaxID=4785 RepID=UPI003559570C|nr:carboxylesterase [Phytophthora cinnamomi]